MKKTIILIIIFLIISSFTITEENNKKIYEIKDTEIPISIEENINLTKGNYTIINEGYKPETTKINCENNCSYKKIWSINEIGNYETIMKIILNNETEEIKKYEFNIEKTYTNSYFLELTKNSFYYKIYTKDMPYNNNHSFKINVNVGEEIEIECIGEYIKCPYNKITAEKEIIEITIDIKVPVTEEWGKTTNSIRITDGEKTGYIYYNFEISQYNIEVEQFIIPENYSCGNEIELINLWQKYFTEKLLELQEANKTIILEKNVTVYETKYQPIVMDETFIKSIYDLKGEVSDARDLINDKKKYEQTINEKDEKITEKQQKIILLEGKIIKCEKNITKIKELNEKEKNKTNIKTIITTIIIISTIIITIWVKKEMDVI